MQPRLGHHDRDAAARGAAPSFGALLAWAESGQETGKRLTAGVAVVPGFSAALAIAQHSDLVALIPASFLIAGSDPLYAFELPVKTREITISQMWHPRSEVDPAHRWLRQLALSVCREKVKNAGYF